MEYWRKDVTSSLSSCFLPSYHELALACSQNLYFLFYKERSSSGRVEIKTEGGLLTAGVRGPVGFLSSFLQRGALAKDREILLAG